MGTTTVWCRVENGGEFVNIWNGDTVKSNIEDLKFINKPSFVVSQWGGFDKIELLSDNHQLKNINELSSLSIIDGLNSVQDSTNFEDFSNHVNIIKSNINSQLYDKVVISRVVNSKIDKNIDLGDIYRNLCNMYPSSMVVLLRSPDLGTWIGASPEVLFRKTGNMFKVMSLAGTLFDNTEKWSDKERKEQSVTTRHIEEVLDGIDYEVSQIHEEHQGTLRHLKQWFTGNVEDEQLELILNKLVPTPAIAGYPVVMGIREIENLELHKRRLYTGYWGLVDHNNWHLQVNLRVAQLFNSSYNLFAGCGINSGSDAPREWEEAGNKMEVVKRALSSD